MYVTKLGEFIATHKYWYELLTKDPYNLKISSDHNFIMFKYNQISSDFNNEIVREARGIIFKIGKWEYPVCRAFDKFGNVGESYVPEIDWNSAVATQKIDGSLIKVWCNENNWHVSTNGCIDAFKSYISNNPIKTFGNLFLEALNVSFEEFTKYLTPDNTYIFELVSPENRIVIPYKKTELYYLGFRDNHMEKFISPFYDSLGYNNIQRDVLRECGIKYPEVYELGTLDSCIEAASKLPWDEEGYVVDDSNYNRVKIKSPAYVIAHHTRNNNNISNKNLIDIILKNETAEFLIYAKEYKKRIKKLNKLMKKCKKVYYKSVKKYKKQIHLSKKEYVLNINKNFYDNQIIIRSFLYKNYDKNMSFEEYSKTWSANKWFNAIDELFWEELFNI